MLHGAVFLCRRGYYGAFLMDNLQLVEQLVSELSQSVSIPVTCKIRIFPELDKTIAYAKMVERSGCSVLAVHGRTREQKDCSAIRADWDAIKAVKQVRERLHLGQEMTALHGCKCIPMPGPRCCVPTFCCCL